MHFETKVIHAGQHLDPAYGAIMPPIYQTSIFALKGVDEPGEFDYTRSGNPTRKALQDCLAVLEKGTKALALGAGMAAEATAMGLLSSGDHIIVHNDLYGGTYRYMSTVAVRNGVEPAFVDLRDLDAFRAAIRPNTKMVWTETPTNPLMNLLNLEAIASIASEHGVLSACDNTFATPCFQNPLELGIDIVMHSTTKYINGHSDVVGGALVVMDEELGEKLRGVAVNLGLTESPFDCYLVLRGLKTLAVRMEAHNRNSLTLAECLQRHPKVVKVLHPGLESHPQHDLALKQMRGCGGTFSFVVKGGLQGAIQLLSNVKLFVMAPSLGGVESLISHPWTVSHKTVPEATKLAAGIGPDLIRVSVGIEHIDDIIADISQALDAVS